MSGRLGHKWWTPWLFLGPNLIGFFCFTLFPLVASFVLAFYAWDLFGEPRWVGTANFGHLLGFSVKADPRLSFRAFLVVAGAALVGAAALSRAIHRKSRVTSLGGGLLVCIGILAALLLRYEPVNPRFWQFMGNTFYLLLALPLSMAGSLSMALLLNAKLPLRNLFRLSVFLPSIVSGVGIYLLWKWIFNVDFGLINQVLSHVGIAGPDWLGSMAWSKNAIIMMSIWATAGGANMILYLAALQNVDPELYEAAKIDGAGPWQRFLHITWPMISPTTAFILIMGIIAGFQGGFDAVYVMTQGGPAGSTTTLSYFIYESAFRNFAMGRAAAASWILAIMVFVLTWISWKWISGKVHY